MKQESRPIKADEVLSIGGHTVFIRYGCKPAQGKLGSIQQILFGQKPSAGAAAPKTPAKR